MKKLIFLGILLAVALYMAPDAMAARARNVNTGKNSRNRATVVDRKEAKVRSFQLGFVGNLDIVGVNTGGNEANKNTGCCDTGDNCGDCCEPCVDGNGEPGEVKIKTGDAEANVTTNDKVNDNYVDIVQGESESKDKAENSCTGQGSRNTAEVKRIRKVSVKNAQIGGVINISAVGVNTGGNSANGNTGGDVKIKTGDAEANVRHTSTVNTNEVWIEQ